MSNTDKDIVKPATETSENTETTTVSTSEADVSTETGEQGSTEATTQAMTEVGSTGMSIPFVTLSVIQCVIALLLIVVVLQQSKTASSMASSALSGTASETESYWNKNKGKSKEGKLAKTTVVLGVIFFIVTFSLGFIK